MCSRLIRYYILFIVLVIPGFSGVTLYALPYSPTDSTHLVVRAVDSKFIDTYRSLKEFDYTIPPLETNFWQQLMNYLRQRFGSWDEFVAKVPLLFKFLFYGLVVFLLFIAITKTRFYQLFYSDRLVGTPDIEFITDNHQSFDFEQAIRVQLDKQHYRMAIRLLYLRVINTLRVKEYIQFSKEKTNVDYLNDLTSEDLRGSFYGVTSIYNHVWYGDTEISVEQYLKFETNFQSFYTAINVEK